MSRMKSTPLAGWQMPKVVILLAVCFTLGVVGSLAAVYLTTSGSSKQGTIEVPAVVTVEQKTNLLSQVGNIPPPTATASSTHTQGFAAVAASSAPVSVQQADPSDKYASQKLNLLNSLHQMH